MTQQALLNKLELLGVYVCRGSVSRIEYGVRTVTDTELLAIARVIEVPIDELFADNEHFLTDRPIFFCSFMQFVGGMLSPFAWQILWSALPHGSAVG